MDALLLIALLAGGVPLEEDIDFKEGRRLVDDDLDYERAVFRFQKVAKSQRPPEERAIVNAWLGLTYANLGDEEQAVEAFVTAIKLDPLVALPPSSPKVAQTFDKARQRARGELKADTDKDGIADAVDRCIDRPETRNGFEDDDGCPDVRPALDSDGDGLADDVDRCPAAPETRNGFNDDDGCPDARPATDSDGDGVKDQTDACPAEAETANGFEDDDGCPDVAPVPAPAAAPSAGPALLIGGAIAVGAGGLGVVLGVTLGVMAQDTSAAAEAAEFQDERQQKANEAAGYIRGANLSYVAGGVLSATGIALLVGALIGEAP